MACCRPWTEAPAEDSGNALLDPFPSWPITSPDRRPDGDLHQVPFEVLALASRGRSFEHTSFRMCHPDPSSPFFGA